MSSTPGLALAALARLRFPTLFLIFAGLFLLDLFVPDFVPFIDELLLGIVTLLLAMLKRRGDPITRRPERVSHNPGAE